MTSKEQIEREQALLDTRPGEPLVWRDGGFIIEKDLAASGNAPPAPAPTPVASPWTPMKVEGYWASTIDGVSVGIDERVRDGRHEVMAWAWCYTDVEERLESGIYGLCEDADLRPTQDPMDTSRPYSIREATRIAAEERASLASWARANMREDERSPLDMVGIARDLAATAQARSREWHASREQATAQAMQDAADIALAARVRRGEQLLKAQEKKNG